MSLALKASNTTRQLSFLFTLVGGVFLLQSCSDSGKTPKKSRHSRSHLVTTLTVKPRPIILTTTRTGTITIKRSVKLFSQEEGEIIMLTVDRGDVVKKNTLLVKIDDALIVVLLAKATATREQARQNLVRNQRLSRKQLVSADQLIKAQTTYKIASSDEKLLKIRVRNTRIIAPFTGIVSDRLAEQGDVVAKHRQVLTMIDPATYIINVQISELLIPYYSVNDTVSIQIDALGTRKFKGKIVRIHPTINPATRQGTLEITMQSTPKGIKAGQLSRVTLTSHPRSGLSIPFNSLRRDKEGEFVFIVTRKKIKLNSPQRRPGSKTTAVPDTTHATDTTNRKKSNHKSRQIKPALTVTRLSVRSGLRHGTLVEIPDGLTINMQVVKQGFLGLRPGKNILIVNSKPATDLQRSKSKNLKPTAHSKNVQPSRQ